MKRVSKITIKTDIYFNHNNIKKYLNNEITKNNYLVIKNQQNKDIENKYVKVGNLGVLLTGYIEYTILYIIDKSLTLAQKNNEGLYTIDSNLFENIIFKNADLKKNFAIHLLDYDSEINYISGLFPTKIINNYISDKISNNIKITENGTNLLSYLLSKSINTLLKNAYYMILYYNKSRITFKSILFSFKSLYTGDFFNTINIKLEQLAQLINEKEEKIINTEDINKDDIKEDNIKEEEIKEEIKN